MSGGHSSSGIGDAIKKGVGMVHGTGEAIRGNFNAAVDQASGDRVGVDKNAAIATKGADEIEHGYHRTGHGAGVTPVDADRERLNTTQTTSTNYGSHSTNTANKLDPRFDSDMDHRGTATGSTNVGHHSNNVANKLDPRIDSDADHRANPSSWCAQTSYSQTDGSDNPVAPFGSGWQPTNALGQDVEHDEHNEHCNCHAQHIHRGSISGGAGLEAAQKLDPVLGNEDASTNNVPHSTNIAKKLDPKVDLDADDHGNVTITKPDGFETAWRSGTNIQTRASTVTRRVTEPSLSIESRCVSRLSSNDDVHHDTPSKGSTALLDEPPATSNTHKNDFLNLLDPKVDRGGSKQMRSSGS